jgi:hypothetical protein
MDYCHEHNRRAGLRARSGSYGLRISLPEGDPMRSLLGDDWHEYQWFATESDRQRRLEELLGQFVYYRDGDRPSFVVEPVEQAGERGESNGR